MKNIGLLIGWILGMFIALPILIISNSVTMEWYIFELCGLLIGILIWLFSNYKMTNK